MHEPELIERVLAGDAAAERTLYDAHVDRIYRLAYRMTGEDDLAQDCTQETFLRAFERLAEFRGDSALGTWLHTVATSVVLNALRKRKRRWRREVAMEKAGPLGRREIGEDVGLRQRLHAAIDDLPDKYRMVFVMHEVEGYTHREIGSALGIEVGTSKAQLSRARARLREALAVYAGEVT
ncbi:MAG: RNA polymerase sigma factor [Candidatus Palauibacterales bacterium]|nr:RNA polymerase sigma factor [Candidatus Palauibacterales bacterium]MDP2529796.1 RNA polymerase sigma factor [Candidatus Palauibacterales bacterium]MDP2582688.1 RNA polymerase sigma factor [Candidatus Palauibacterales bacterium]